MAKIPSYDELLKLALEDRSQVSQLISDSQKALKDSEVQSRKDAKAKLDEFAKSLGFSVLDLYSDAKGKRGEAGAKEKPPAKFANPKDPNDTWSGRGRRPQFVQEHLAAGGGINELLIDKG